MRKTRILLVLLAWAVSPVFMMSHSYYIIPNNNTTCNQSQFEACLTLQQFSVKNSSDFIDSNVTLTFADGKHSLTEVISFSSNTEVVLRGSMTVAKPEITCTVLSANCFSFTNILRVAIENLIFTECGKYNGDVLFIHQTELVSISQCYFASNLLSKLGGVIQIIDTSNVHIFQSWFFNNSAVCLPSEVPACTLQSCIGRGGVISVNNVTEVFIQDSVFEDNMASTEKGGVLSTAFSFMRVYNSEFIKNTAMECSNGVGGLLIISSHVEISSSVFKGNRGWHGGAILSSSNDSKVKIHSSSFLFNRAEINGGAGYFIENSLQIMETTFDSNTAPRGGALAIVSSKTDMTSIISNSTFLSNTGILVGGAIFLFLEGTPCTKQCTHSNVKPTGNESVVSITDCVFISNGASSLYGGAIQAYNGVLNITNSTFIKQKMSGLGAVVNSDYGFLYIQGNTFSRNSAGIMGGVLYSSNGVLNCFKNEFLHNDAGYGGAINTYDSVATFRNDQYTSNTAIQDGGALFLVRTTVKLLDNLFTYNVVSYGRGAAIFQTDGFITLQSTALLNNNGSKNDTYVVHLTNAHGIWNSLTFENNQGSIFLLYSVLNFTGLNSLTNNTGISGGALTLVQSTVTFDEQSQVNISNNIANNGGGMFLSQSTLNVNSPSLFISNNIAIMSGGGLFCYQSQIRIESTGNQALGSVKLKGNWAVEGGAAYHTSTSLNIFKGLMLFSKNEAFKGGAMFLSENSRVYILKSSQEDHKHLNVSLILSNNTASYGGALYVSDASNAGILCGNSKQSPQSVSAKECFIQTLRLYYTLNATFIRDFNYFNIFFFDNFGSISGSDIFGGLLDRCQLNLFSEVSENFHLQFGTFDGIQYIKAIAQFQIGIDYGKISYNPRAIANTVTGQRIQTLISSSATKLCFCSNKTYNCAKQHPTMHRRKGESFSVNIITVDQVENPVNGTVLVTVISSGTSLKVDQSQQETNGVCTELFYNVFSTQDNATIQLYPDGPCANMGISSKEITITFLPCECPNGLQPAAIDNECRCECDSTLNSIMSQCLLANNNLTIVRRTADVWIQYVNNDSTTGFVYSECPFDYCLVEPVNLSFSLPSQADTQCAYNRSGVLCGECEEGLSLVFGSSRCVLCSNNYLALLIAFAVAGIALVAFILILNLTVAVGTIHGLILYANIVATNSPTFLPSETALRLFVSWVNLDLGIETCFYDGMESYAKVLLQLVFPAYVIFLSVLIIVVSFYWGRFAGLIGRKNPVATVCTLFLLSYSKLLQTIIASLQFAPLTYPSGVTEVLWLYNPNIPYFTPAHIPMFIIAGVILVLGTIYTVLLFCGQWLRKLQKVKCLQNNKYNAFVDAYHAPFKFKYRYWIGVLLFTRIIHHLLTAVLSESIHPLIVSCMVCALLFLKLVMINIFKSRLIDLLETSFLINLLLFAVGTYYTRLTNVGNQVFVVNTSVTVSFVTFCIILFYHSHVFFLKSFNSYNNLVANIKSCFEALYQKLKTLCTKPDQETNEHTFESSTMLCRNLLREPALEILAPITSQDYTPFITDSLPAPLRPATTTIVDIENK